MGNMYEKYKKLRDERGMTDYAVTKALGFSRGTLYQWKSGQYTPKLDKLKKIADYFGVTVDYFLE